jgi:hypothetical protein
MSPASDQDIDALILSTAVRQWRKVAFIIGTVLMTYRKSAAETNEDIIADRVRALVDAGKLESQGNLNRWRHSEVRLPDDVGQKS